MTDKRLATFAVGRRGVQVAERIRRSLGGDAFVPARWRDLAGDRAQAFPEGGVSAAVRRAFASYEGLVLVLPLGIAVRLLAPEVRDKRSDPAVVVVDEAGKHAIALLSGHLGGANDLARDVAAAVGAQPVITTSAEALGSLALDLLGQEWGWTIADARGMTRASAALISGEPVGAYQDAGEEDWWREAPGHLARYSSLEALVAAPVAARIVVTDRAMPLFNADSMSVVFQPRTLVVGVGCVRGIAAAELQELIDAALAHGGLAAASVRGLATIDLKADEAGLNELAGARGWSVQYFSARKLAGTAAPSGPSPVVQEAVGTPAVCEPAALRAAGAAELLVPKTQTPRATVAIARVVQGMSVGHLAVVGLGPGGREDLTERGRQALEAADVVVGYQAYVDLVRPWLGPKTYHASAIGNEIDRCRLALDLMDRGRSVALISSGDAGIYGMAGLVFELIDEKGDLGLAARIDVIPGVSAAQAAAALLGGPLMSDFATISLSDLLTPWPAIEARLEAVGQADLVVAVYNPASGRRRTQLARAREILLRHRSPTTPVGLVRNASRPGQAVVVTDLGNLLEHPADMLTTVIVGNSATVRIGDRMTTRRGYPTGPAAHVSDRLSSGARAASPGSA